MVIPFAGHSRSAPIQYFHIAGAPTGIWAKNSSALERVFYFTSAGDYRHYSASDMQASNLVWRLIDCFPKGGREPEVISGRGLS